MDSSSTQESLELEVKDFGPIVKAKIDLRPLTVFIGPSNTGKSYMAILIYALHRYFSGGDVLSGRRYPRRGYPMFPSIARRKLSAKTHHALNEWIEQTFTDSGKLSHEKHIVLSAPVADVIHSEFSVRGDALVNEIARCFGTDGTRALVRKENRDGAHVVLRRCQNDSTLFEHGLKIRAAGTEFETTVPEGTPMRVGVRDADELVEYLHRMAVDRTDERENLWVSRLLSVLVRLTLPHLFGPLHRPAFYLPADRTGVMHAHNVVVSALIESASMTGLRPAARTPMLAGVLADFLEQLIELDHPRSYPRQRPLSNLGTRIEKAILDGAVGVDRSEATSYPRFTYRPEGWKDDLPLMNASSMVSELAPVVLYLRHMVHSGSVLIIEEPESHLHPSMQVEFTRQLAALVNSGIRVLITTHSEWVLEELANIVRRSELPKPSRKDIAAGNVALRSDQVGAWLFLPQRRPKGSVVKEIRLDDSGLYPSGFGEVAAALHNNWAEISSRIGETE